MLVADAVAVPNAGLAGVLVPARRAKPSLERSDRSRLSVITWLATQVRPVPLQVALAPPIAALLRGNRLLPTSSVYSRSALGIFAVKTRVRFPPSAWIA